MARGLKFRIKEVEELYNLCSENKGADQLRGKTVKLFCVFVFAYAKSWFSYDEAHLDLACGKNEANCCQIVTPSFTDSVST